MVHVSEKKLIIEMDAHCPVDDIQALQKEIIGAIQCYNYNDFGNTDGCPFLVLLELLQATLPTFQQQRQMLEFTEMANDPAISKTAIVEWFTSRTEFLKKEISNQ